MKTSHNIIALAAAVLIVATSMFYLSGCDSPSLEVEPDPPNDVTEEFHADEEP